MGLSPAAVAGELRNKFLGAEVHQLQRGRDELGVVVRYPPDRMRSLADLLDEQVSPWRRYARAVWRSSPTWWRPRALAPSRDSTASWRPESARAWIQKSQLPAKVTAHLEQEILPVLEARFPGLSLSKAGQYNLQETFAEVLYLLVPIALLLIYGLIAVQLRSYVQPLLVLASIPFGVAGAVLGHFVLGYDLSAVSVIGIVAAAGVVINDTLVLLDRYNRIDPDGEMPAVSRGRRRRATSVQSHLPYHRDDALRTPADAVPDRRLRGLHDPAGDQPHGGTCRRQRSCAVHHPNLVACPRNPC